MRTKKERYFLSPKVWRLPIGNFLASLSEVLFPPQELQGVLTQCVMHLGLVGPRNSTGLGTALKIRTVRVISKRVQRCLSVCLSICLSTSLFFLQDAFTIYPWGLRNDFKSRGAFLWRKKMQRLLLVMSSAHFSSAHFSSALLRLAQICSDLPKSAQT